MKDQKVEETITISPHILNLLHARAQAIGVSVSDYVGYLTINDVQTQHEYVEKLEGDDLQEFLTGVEDIKQGRSTVVDVSKHGALDEFLQS